MLFLMLLAMDVMEPVPSVCREPEAGVEVGVEVEGWTEVEGGERGREGDRVCAHAVTSSVEPK
jgi:hypothetical protein